MNISEINLLFQVSKPKQPMEEIIIKSWDQYEKDYKESIDDPASFWSNVADKLEWKKPYDKVLEWEFETPTIKWFEGGKINMAENCLDRHLKTQPDKTALIWEPNDPNDPGLSWTYAQLHEEVCKFANVLKAKGVEKGDRVCIYMPMVPQLTVALLACARIGAIHSVVFAGFSAQSLADRINDATCKVVLTSDGSFRGHKEIPIKDIVDEALAKTNSVETVIVYKRTGQFIRMEKGRDVWWHDEIEKVDADCPAESMDAEDPLYILYTSGSTGKPKGVIHTTAGYMVSTYYTFLNVFQYEPEDIYWCTADIGWVTGHSYIVYGPLVNGATQVLYEGTPDTPDKDRWWQVVAKYGVTIFYTAPTAIRACRKRGRGYPDRHDLSSLRVMGSVGEPTNPEAWIWYREVIGGDTTPIVDTWWQTETGAIMISPLPGVTATKPGAAQVALPGIGADVYDEAGDPVGNGEGGYLVLTQPWPAMLRGVWGDDERFRSEYWSQYPGEYFAGDGAKKDDDGDLWVLGRVDDVMNVSGHRMSTTEIESALVSHPSVAEAAVVGASDDTTGQAIVAFVILRGDAVAGQDGDTSAIITELRNHVATEIGPIARPRSILVVAELPKTRSGKIMRRLLRDVAENRPVGDVTTLADSTVMDQITSGMQTSGSSAT